MKPKHKIQVNMGNSYKLGMDEVVGLRAAIVEAFQPVTEFIKDKTYWNDELAPDDLEYKSRDGFIPHSHNCGGLMLGVHVPECESYEFSFLEFGECDECTAETQCGKDGAYCSSNDDGYNDAYLRIIFKFEGINDDGELEFYINACGGNGDAPYFRVQHLTDIFEASFTCKSVKGVKRAANKHIKALLKAMGAK